MKQNIILFIIIGIFLFTVLFFKNKEGVDSTLTPSTTTGSGTTTSSGTATSGSGTATSGTTTSSGTATSGSGTATSGTTASSGTATSGTVAAASTTSGVAATASQLGDTCANKTASSTTNCDWNNNSNDKSDWWNEHLTSTDSAINSVKWNHHTIDVGDYKTYPNCYRDPSDKTNGPADASFLSAYSKQRETEAKEALTAANNYKRIQSQYDASFNIYKSMLENDARTISSINEEKERYKRDISNASTTRTIYSDEYEYYAEEEGVDGSICPSLKCVADFGTNIGENLCCGQTGVLQNTEYVCPSVKPTCQNFKCGSKFGTCV